MPDRRPYITGPLKNPAPPKPIAEEKYGEDRRWELIPTRPRRSLDENVVPVESVEKDDAASTRPLDAAPIFYIPDHTRSTKQKTPSDVAPDEDIPGFSPPPLTSDSSSPHGGSLGAGRSDSVSTPGVEECLPLRRMSIAYLLRGGGNGEEPQFDDDHERHDPLDTKFEHSGQHSNGDLPNYDAVGEEHGRGVFRPSFGQYVREGLTASISALLGNINQHSRDADISDDAEADENGKETYVISPGPEEVVSEATSEAEPFSPTDFALLHQERRKAMDGTLRDIGSQFEDLSVKETGRSSDAMSSPVYTRTPDRALRPMTPPVNRPLDSSFSDVPQRSFQSSYGRGYARAAAVQSLPTPGPLADIEASKRSISQHGSYHGSRVSSQYGSGIFSQNFSQHGSGLHLPYASIGGTAPQLGESAAEIRSSNQELVLSNPASTQDPIEG
ncbi:hypothetical protein IWX90DRAFT_436317 [Phyllosticta citrichinensis]|uniref:Uncharacterized protein n=1 Tax=Phyllosticta citrichinensis TaxID=1130410 RepID=A0ABR1XRN2_9PEZI